MYTPPLTHSQSWYVKHDEADHSRSQQPKRVQGREMGAETRVATTSYVIL